jgi:microcystin-dependent protein
MAISIPYPNFVSGTTIVADEHDANNAAIAAFVDALQAGTNFNAGAIGTTAIADDAITSAKIAANAVALSELASAVANALVPVGTVTPYAGATAPTGWLIADGSAVSRSTYSQLFTLVSTTYGAGDGTTTFNIPNLKGKVPVGLDATQTEFDALAETGGAKTHTLTVAELAAHSHALSSGTVTVAGTIDNFTVNTNTTGVNVQSVSLVDLDHRHTATAKRGTNSLDHNGTTTFAAGGTSASEASPQTSTATSIASGSMNHTHTVVLDDPGHGHTGSATFTQTSGTVSTLTLQNTGGGSAHNNLQPYIVLNYIIKAQNI